MKTPRTVVLTLGAGLALTLALSACGSSAGTGASSSGSSPSPTASASGSGGGNGSAGQRFSGASGLVAQVSGSTAQVQSASSQTAVSWTASTTFTKQVAATSSALAVGECVTARPATQATSRSGSSSPGTAPTTISAATVQLSQPVDGQCVGQGGLGGNRGAGAGSAGSGSAQPSPSRSTGQGGAMNRRGGFGAFGTIATVGSGSFTVSSPATGSQSARTTTVDYGASTTFTTQASAGAGDVQVGECLSAVGPHDTTGAVTATSIRLAPAVNGQCANGFGRRPGTGSSSGASTGTGNA